MSEGWRITTIAFLAGGGFGMAIYALFDIQKLSNRLHDIENKLADKNSIEENGYT